MIKINKEKEKVQLAGASNTLIEELGVATAAFLKAAADINEETFTEHASLVLLNTIATIHKYEKRHHYSDTLNYVLKKLEEVE